MENRRQRASALPQRALCRTKACLRVWGGWCCAARRPFSDAAVDELLARLGDPADVLLVVDYVEMVADFADRVEHLEMRNAVTRRRVRYIANCRTSDYRNVQTIAGRSASRHARVR